MSMEPSFWHTYLIERPEAIDLPLDLDRPAVRGRKRGRVHFEADADLVLSLKGLASSIGVSFDSLLFTAFSVFISKSTYSQEFQIGRLASEGAKLRGAFPKKITLKAGELFSDCVRRLAGEILQNETQALPPSYSHCFDLVSELDLNIDPSRHPLFDSFFSLGTVDPDFRGDLSSLLGDERTDLSLFLIEKGDRLEGVWDYSSDLFGPVTIQSFSKRVKNICEQVVKSPQQRVEQLSLLDLQETTQLIQNFSSPHFNWPRRFLLHELFEARVDLEPDSVALVFENHSLTYAELDAAANSVAQVLAKQGVLPDQVVGLFADRSFEMIIGMLGILKAGGAYLPIDPEVPAARLLYLAQDSQMQVLLAGGPTLAERAQETIGQNQKIVDLTQLEHSKAGRVSRQANPSSAAYVIYTSGSTGLPKGVVVEHRNIAHLIMAEREALSIRKSDRILQFSSFTFDASIEQTWLALSTGACLVLCSKRVLGDPHLAGELIRREKITHLDTVPLFLAELSPTELPDLKRVIVGGETCPVRLAAIWKDHVTFFNEYGPTETTVSSLRYQVRTITEGQTQIPIGHPIGLTRPYVLDWGGCPVPVGVKGELYLGGAGVARGYLNRQNLTLEKFLPDPFSLEAGSQMYRTGDLTRWDLDGNILFSGRKDHQIKIRGFRIELGEVDAAVATHDGIAAACAQVWGERSEQMRICVYYVLKKEGSLPWSELQAYLREKLPAYMVPDDGMQLSELPVTLAGKVDRRRLPKPLRGDPSQAFVDPETRIESEVRQIWAELLGLETAQISVVQDFFSLGGHSLLLMRLLTRVRAQWGAGLTATEVFQQPTIRAMSRSITRILGRSQPEQLFSIERSELDVFEATSVQRRLYVVQQGNPQSTAYNLPLLYEISGELDPGQLEMAFRALIEGHESLRTGLFFQGGKILQKIAAQFSFKLESYEIGNSTAEDFASQSFVRPFMLEEAPLFRAAIFKQEGLAKFLAIDMHHIVSDGTSIDVLLEDLVELLRGRKLTLPPVRYLDYSRWALRPEVIAERQKAREYWRQLLADELPVLDLPFDFHRPSSRRQSVGTYEFKLDATLMAQVLNLSQKGQATPFALFSSVYAIFLSCMTGSADVVFGFPTAGRPEPELQRVVGMFVNTLIHRSRIDLALPFAEFLRQTMQQIRGSLQAEQYLFEDLVEEFRIPSMPGRNPAFDTMLSYEGFLSSKLDCGTVQFMPKAISQPSARMDLVWIIREVESGYSLILEYSSDLFKRSTIERFALGLKKILIQILQEPQTLLSQIDVFEPGERDLVCSGFNQNQHLLPEGVAVHHLFERRAEQIPESPAVIFRDKVISYQQLEHQANRLAHELLALGLKKESIVGILLDPCAESLVCVLGVLKAGAAFMPIDSEYPDSRKQFMLADSGARVLLTKSALTGEWLKEFSGKVIDIDLFGELDQSETKAVARPQVAIGPHDLAYVIYTSGSTGKPKGVQIEQHSLLNFSAWYADYFELTPGVRVSKYAGFGFDASISELLPTLIGGACMVVVPTETRFSLEGMDAFFADFKVDVAFLPSQFGEQFIKHANRHSLRSLFLGGEKMRSYHPCSFRIVNAYGPTEYTVITTVFEVKQNYDNIPIGAPIWNTETFIFDRAGRLAPVGVPGELCISGESIARGYLGRPELTAEKFVPHPFDPERRMYLTGDLARWRSDGNIEFLGRIDTQVKVRGFRIELGEIENALMLLPSVDDAVVVAREGTGGAGDLTLIAFVTFEGPVRSDEKQLKSELGKTLPPYMIPSRVIELHAIPVTANGKVDKRRLPEVALESTDVVKPSTSLERFLVPIYSRVLGVPETALSVASSFHDLGGHSLKAAVLLSEVYREKGIQVRLSEFLQRSSIIELARLIESETGRHFEWPKGPELSEYPLSSSQKRILAVCSQSPWSTAYNIPFLWEIERSTDLVRLERGLRELLVRHESLRATFFVDGGPEGSPVQRFVSADLALDSKTFAFEQYSSMDSEVKAVFSQFVRPFDLTQPFLFRAGVIRTPDRICLAVDIHHIVADGLSLRTLIEDLQKYYKETLAEVDHQPRFKDFLAWETGDLGRARKDEEKSWWIQKFGDPSAQLELPYDFDRPTRFSFEGDSVYVDLPKEVSIPLASMAKARNITPLGVFVAAYGVALSRLGNTSDLTVGIPAGGRNLPGLEGVVGMFVNTVPLRMKLEAKESFADLSVRIAQDALESFERQTYQLNDLITDLALPRDVSRNPLFDVVFAWEDMELISMDGGPLGLREIATEAQSAKFDLELSVQNTKAGQRLVLQFCKKLFRRATAERFLGHIRSILEQAARVADAPISDFGMLLPWEREMVLSDFNRTDFAMDPEQTLLKSFISFVKTQPQARAVEDWDERLDFAELDRQSTIVCDALLVAGIKPGDIVSLSLKRSVRILVAILGVWKARAAYLPMEPETPSDRVRHMVEDSQSKVLLIEAGVGDFGLHSIPVLIWQNLDWSRVPIQRGFESLPTDKAYVIYTSGSTGKPKGVLVNQASLANFIFPSVEHLGVTDDEGILLFSSFTFDASLAQMGLALATGARLVVPTKELLLDFDEFENFIISRNVTHLDAVPLFLGAFTPKRPLSLKRVIVGGDICPVQTATRWRSICPVFNEYGPTETTVTALRYNVAKGDASLKRLPIGRPVANTRAYILDWSKNLAPLGVPGELYIGGDGVAVGYLENPALTAEKFLPSPYRTGDRIYRTGDIAKWNRDGSIDYLGRSDHQVKIRGFRIELGEIEAAILSQVEVAEVAVVIWNAPENPRLCAYVVLASGFKPNVAHSQEKEGGLKSFDPTELRSRIARQLPSYMVPDAWVVMETLPVTQSGKVDRKKLPEPVFGETNMAESPATPAEEKLLDIWSEVLRTPRNRIPIERSFFELGGHSLMVMMLISKIQRTFGVRLLPPDLFDNPTVRTQAKLISSRERVVVAAIPKLPERPYYPLSSVQRRLFAMQQSHPDSVSYNMPSVYRVDGTTTPERIEEVLRALIARHSSFRTTFGLEQGVPVQRVLAKVQFKLQQLDGEKSSIDDLMQRLMRPFDLAQTPLLRAWFVKTIDHEQYLIVDMPHIISDGYSSEILWQEAGQIIRGEVDLPMPRLNYTDFVGWTEGEEYRARVHAQKEFWLQRFADIPAPLELPYDHRRPNTRTYEGGLVITQLSRVDHQRIIEISKLEGATVFSTMLTCFFVFLERISGSEDLVVGIPASGRVHPDIQDIVGMFVNSIPLRTQVPETGTFREFLSQVWKMSLQYQSQQDYQFEDLLTDLGIRAEAGRNPLFDVMFVHQGKEENTIDAGEVRLTRLDFQHHTAKMDLILIVTESDQGIELAFEYSTELFAKSTIERLARNLTSLISQVLRNPDAPIIELVALDDLERFRLLGEFNSTSQTLPQVRAVQEIFEKFASEAHDQPCVIFKEQIWSYAEVNRRANAIADWLRRQGVRPEEVVPVLLDPRPEQLPALLGVLKAGAAFLPIDSEYPASRIQYMIEDSGARFVLTRQGLIKSKIEHDSEAWPGCLMKVLQLDVEDLKLYEGEFKNPSLTSQLDHLAYVIYTSGSTGKPKGVMIEHRNLLNFSLSWMDLLGVRASDISAKYAGFSFDASISEFFPACLSGGALCVVPAEIRLSIDELNSYFLRSGVTVAFLPTQFGELFMKQAENPTLRALFLGGDKVRTFKATGYSIYNAYGPTENTVCTTGYRLKEQLDNIPIGKPLWNNKIFILDRQNRLCPIGVAGELCVSGANVGRGYLNRSDLTDQKFVPNPYLLDQRMYRTGDLARWLDDGNIEFLGRIDTQVKIRGFRVELGEIEQVLLANAEVAEAIVIDATDASGAKYLVAYLVHRDPQKKPDSSFAAIKAELGKVLPEYMVPSQLMWLERLPLTPNGKVDRKALPKVALEHRELIPLASPLEEEVAHLWAKVLSVDLGEIGALTRFMDLGGQSLKAVTLVGEIYKRFALFIKVSEVMQQATVRSIAQKIEQNLAKTTREGKLPGITRRLEALSYPLSSVQKRIFLTQELQSDSTAYNVPALYRISKVYDKRAVERALQKLSQIHEVLRIQFVMEGTEVRQRVLLAPIEFNLKTVQTTETELRETAKSLVRPFASLGDFLYRASWVETETSQYLFFDVHHLITDGASMGILLEELTKSLEMPDAPILTKMDWVDYVLWERSPVVSASVEAQRKFWKDLFVAGLPTFEILTDFSRPPTPVTEGATQSLKIPREVSQALRLLAKENGISMNALLNAVASVFLSKINRQDDVLFGAPASGRWHPDMQGIVGMFVNTLVVWTKPDANRTFLEFAKEVSGLFSKILDNQAFPFSELIELVGAPQRAGRSAVFDVMFVYQNSDEKTNERTGDPTLTSTLRTVEPIAVENETAKFDYTLLVNEDRDDLTVALEYRTSLFRASTIEQYLRCFSALCQSVVQTPKEKIGQHSILSAEDRDLVLNIFNHTQVEFKPHRTALTFFDEMVENFSSRTALQFATDLGPEIRDEQYTYREMEIASNRLAHRLQHCGVERESIVAILTRPCCEMILAMFSVWKSGGAFLPIDPAYPRERIEYMLRDSGARVLLVDPGVKTEFDWTGERIPLTRGAFIDGPAEKPELVSDAHDLAYIIYTSGSSGRPKAVAVEHQSLVHFTQWMISFFDLTHLDRGSKFAGFGFDASILETLPILCSGAGLYIVPEEIRLSLPELDTWYRKHQISFSFLPTQLGEEFAKRPAPPHLRWLVVGGDRLRRFTKTPYKMVNAYGPTEYTVVATAFSVDQSYENIPIGKPIANTRLLILDPSGRLCPPRVPGEICLEGKSISRGYLQNADLTALKFVAHPDTQTERMYLTGDLGRWLEDGNIEFLGRIDSQVKIRGFRIELGEIEQAILEVPGVYSAVVLDREYSSQKEGDRFLCGYYVASPVVTVDLLRDALAQRLPAYMLPTVWVKLDHIPFTPNGKVDRAKLPIPDLKPSEREVVAPRSVAESIVLETFARTLGRSDLGIDDDFFDFGGNSLKAVSAVAELASDFKITANDLFRLRTVRRIVAEIAMSKGDLKERLTRFIESLSEVLEERLPEEIIKKDEEYRKKWARFENQTIQGRKTYRNILLTGATGFLGSYLLRDLLHLTEAKIFVTIRAKSRQEAWDRLKAKAEYYFGTGAVETYRRRIVLVLSDLSKPGLGIEAELWERLKNQVDCVVHAAALTKHYGNYSDFVEANVDSTRALTELARAARADFNFVSTLSVAMGDIPNTETVLFTEYDCDLGQTTSNHYVRTKLEAEKLVLKLRAEGLVCNIFRVGFLTPDSQTHRFQENAEDSAFSQKLASFLNLKRIPVGALVHSFCPVDQVSQAITQLFSLSALANETHHLERWILPEEAWQIGQADERCKVMKDQDFYTWLRDHLEEPGVARAATVILLHEGFLDQKVTTQTLVRQDKTDLILRRIGIFWCAVDSGQVWGMLAQGEPVNEKPSF